MFDDDVVEKKIFDVDWIEMDVTEDGQVIELAQSKPNDCWLHALIRTLSLYIRIYNTHATIITSTN